eukprot:jgi/Botrbrau1/6912/Bobra.67_3s0030.1
MVGNSDDSDCDDPMEEPLQGDPCDCDSAEARKELIQVAFSQLKPVCVPILANRNDRSGLTSRLQQLNGVLKEVGRLGLQGCLEYVLCPLLLIINSIPTSRGALGPGDQAAPSKPAVPAAAADSVAEGSLACIISLLRKCCPNSPEVLLDLLQSLAAVIDIPRASTSEEVRGMGLRAIRILLCQLHNAPAGTAGALRQETNAPLLAYLSSLFLRVAEEEAAAGASGSKALRAAALRALRTLITIVGDGDALAFILPGVVSRLSRALVLAGVGHGTRKQTGAVASSAATLQVVQAFTAIVLATLGDSTLPPAPQARDHADLADTSGTTTPTTAQAALNALALIAKSAAEAEKEPKKEVGGEQQQSVAEREEEERKRRAGVPVEQRRVPGEEGPCVGAANVREGQQHVVACPEPPPVPSEPSRPRCGCPRGHGLAGQLQRYTARQHRESSRGRLHDGAGRVAPSSSPLPRVALEEAGVA